MSKALRGTRQRGTGGRLDVTMETMTVSDQLFLPKRLVVTAPAVRLAAVIVMFTAAFGVRLYKIGTIEFVTDYQYQSLLTARHLYYEGLENIPEQDRVTAKANFEVFSHCPGTYYWLHKLVAFLFRVFGGEYIWIPQVVDSLFWLTGGVFLYFIGKRLISVDGAILSVAYYLFGWYGVSASRSFMPDIPMVMLMLAAVLLMLRYFERQRMWELLAVSVVSLACVLVLPKAMFMLCGGFCLAFLAKNGFRKIFVSLHVMIYLLFAVVLPNIYFFFLAGVPTHGGHVLLFHLVKTKGFWKGWADIVECIIGSYAFWAALLGILTFRKGVPKWLIIGLWAGYFVFGLVFTYHIHTHQYYQLQLIPVVGLCLGSIGAWVIERFRRMLERMSIRWLALIYQVAISITLCYMVFKAGKYDVGYLRSRTGIDKAIRVAQEVGKHVGHSNKVAWLDAGYGQTLRYYGNISGWGWPSTGDLEGLRKIGAGERNLKDQFNRMMSDGAEYFVVTCFEDFERQKDLQGILLEGGYPVLSRTQDYTIYDLRQSKSVEK